MSSQSSLKALLFVVAILLVANLVRPLFQPGTAFAQSEPKPEVVEMTGSSSMAWILKGNLLYYVKFENQFESIRIYGPEELEN